jgi:2-polyprenyl-3-methyl-5-hydroxy-6-metoxy-1,4-benzoquinol methylase
MDRDIFDAHIEHDETHWWFEGRRAIVSSLIRKIPKATGRHILDVGSGAGGMISTIQELGKVTALESDPKMFEYLQNRFGEDIAVIKNTWGDGDFGKYDIITMFDVLEHIDDERAALQRILTSLGSHGFFVCTVPAFQFLWSEHDVAAHHKRRYTKKELANKLREAGFNIQYITYFTFFLFLPILLVRLFSRFHKKTKTDFEIAKIGFLSRILKIIFASEAKILRFVSLPFGVSLFCIAKKST